MRESFIFYRSFWDAIKELSPEDREKSLTAIMEYALNDKIDHDLKGVSQAIFSLTKPQIDANNRRYENGKRGGRPKKETEVEPKKNRSRTKKKPNNNLTETEKEPIVILDETKVEPNVNDNVNVNVNDNIISPPVITEDMTLHKKVEATFLDKQLNYQFTNFGKEGKAIKELIEKGEARAIPGQLEVFIFGMIDQFQQLRETGNSFWQGQPFLPSVLNSSSIFDRVLAEAQRKYEAVRLPEPAQGGFDYTQVEWE